MVHHANRFVRRLSIGSALAMCSLLTSLPFTLAASAGDLEPPTPAAFFPEGLLGVQIGGVWQSIKSSPMLQQMRCQPAYDDARDFDEVCFFKASSASRVAGARIHDGFIVRKDDRVVLIGTGITIKSADDPLAESVMQSLELQVHSAFQQRGAEVLFVKMPGKPMSPEEFQGYSQKAPVLLVQLEPTGSELAVLYGYLAPVNVFGAIASN